MKTLSTHVNESFDSNVNEAYANGENTIYFASFGAGVEVVPRTAGIKSKNIGIAGISRRSIDYAKKFDFAAEKAKLNIDDAGSQDEYLEKLNEIRSSADEAKEIASEILAIAKKFDKEVEAIMKKRGYKIV